MERVHGNMEGCHKIILESLAYIGQPRNLEKYIHIQLFLNIPHFI